MNFLTFFSTAEGQKSSIEPVARQKMASVV
jgi:hypothetical protein